MYVFKHNFLMFLCGVFYLEEKQIKKKKLWIKKNILII
jgi:hypothetical protein